MKCSHRTDYPCEICLSDGRAALAHRIASHLIEDMRHCYAKQVSPLDSTSITRHPGGAQSGDSHSRGVDTILSRPDTNQFTSYKADRQKLNRTT